MKKLTKKGSLILYACSGLGVNMLNMIADARKNKNKYRRML